MLRRWLTVLLAVLTALVAASPASASMPLGPQTRVGAFELAAHTLVGGPAARTPENHRAKSPAKPADASDPRLRWKARPFLSDVGGGVYDMRARWWSPRLGAFLEADNFGYTDASSTLWGWPRQNPARWSDRSGRFGEEAADPATLAALGNAILLASQSSTLVGSAASAGAAAGIASGLAAAAIAAPVAIAGAVIAHDLYAFHHPTISHADPDARGEGGSCSASGGGSMGGGGGGPPIAPPPAPGAGDDDDDPNESSSGTYVYQLVDENGDPVYYGISNDPARRLGEHALGEAFPFSGMQVISAAQPLAQAQALETSLIQAAGAEGRTIYNVAATSISPSIPVQVPGMTYPTQTLLNPGVYPR